MKSLALMLMIVVAGCRGGTERTSEHALLGDAEEPGDAEVPGDAEPDA